MDTLHLFLEGPGRETIPVTTLDAESYGSPQVTNEATRRTLVDDNGNIAEQTDKSGYRYQFRERFGIWSLIVSD
ncbi:hypothetical protein ABB26_15000 [Stenotrophomonas humi]|uniref:Uncharacterized protein n=1 Tax=Stenotrophomonas humi TaxID=405444 RepID=A0A0R0C023_9GAMM|nr:hypothetical protein [Stenotrophomonas humi]KRG62774.1 hypothetical protein ABB26_15000 [Stenotrophomonas humi]